MTGLFTKYNGLEKIFILLTLVLPACSRNGVSAQEMSSLSTYQPVTKQLISGDKNSFPVSKPSTTGTARNSTLETSSTHTGSQIYVIITHAIKFNMLINKQFPTELHDPSSESYYRYETELTNALQKTFHVLPGFEGILIEGFQNKSDKIVCDFYLQTSDISAITATQEQFWICLKELKNVIVDEASVIVDEQSMLDQYFKVVRALSTDDNCRRCSNGTFCTYQNMFLCASVCSLVSDKCHHKGGCLYDPVQKKPACRCPFGVPFSESENECVSDDQTKNTSQQNNTTIYICTIIPAVLTSFTAITVAYIKIRKSESNKSNEETPMDSQEHTSNSNNNVGQ